MIARLVKALLKNVTVEAFRAANQVSPMAVPCVKQCNRPSDLFVPTLSPGRIQRLLNKLIPDLT